MGWESISYQILEIACENGHRPSLAEFKAARGACRACRTRYFDVVIERSVVSGGTWESPSAGELASKTLFGVSTSSLPGMHDAAFELKNVDGRELILVLAKPPKEIGEWMLARRKSDALAALRPDQKLCATCGSIFTPPKYGRVADGFCSPRCRNEQLPAAADVDCACPHCGQVLTIPAAQAGKLASCPSCRQRFLPGS